MGRILAEHLVILKVNLGIQAKAFADGPDGGRFRRELVGYILPGGKVVGFVGEFAAAGVFRGGDVGAFFLHRGGYGADQLLDGSFRTLHVEYDKSFVISHGLVIIRNVSCERCAPCGQVRCNDCLQKASLFFTLFPGTCRFLRFTLPTARKNCSAWRFLPLSLAEEGGISGEESGKAADRGGGEFFRAFCPAA